jgi:two-component system LytT family response regulator
MGVELPITVLIADDEPPARARLRSLLAADPEVKIVAECANGASAIAAIRQLSPALLFLDIEMPEGDGFDVIAALECLPAIVFVTAYPNYAIPAFEACALDYLLKPFKVSRFHSVLARAKSHIRRYAEYDRQQDALRQFWSAQRLAELLVVKVEGRLVFVRQSDLRWVEAEKDYIRLHLRQGAHLVRETMNGIQNRLDQARFVRIHRSTIVNVGEICEVRPWPGGDCGVLLRDRTQLTLSRRHRSALDGLLRAQRVDLPG